MYQPTDSLYQRTCSLHALLNPILDGVHSVSPYQPQKVSIPTDARREHKFSATRSTVLRVTMVGRLAGRVAARASDFGANRPSHAWNDHRSRSLSICHSFEHSMYIRVDLGDVIAKCTARISGGPVKAMTCPCDSITGSLQSYPYT